MHHGNKLQTNSQVIKFLNTYLQLYSEYYPGVVLCVMQFIHYKSRQTYFLQWRNSVTVWKRKEVNFTNEVFSEKCHNVTTSYLKYHNCFSHELLTLASKYIDLCLI